MQNKQIDSDNKPQWIAPEIEVLDIVDLTLNGAGFAIDGFGTAS